MIHVIFFCFNLSIATYIELPYQPYFELTESRLMTNIEKKDLCGITLTNWGLTNGFG